MRYPLPIRQASALPSGFLQTRGHPRNPCLWLTLPHAGRVEDFHLQVSAPCRAHRKKGHPKVALIVAIYNRLMPEVAHAAEHHGHTALVGGGDDLVVAHGATGLDDAGGALVHHHIQAVTEREEGVAGDYGTGQ